jgi:hypothetical protein
VVRADWLLAGCARADTVVHSLLFCGSSRESAEISALTSVLSRGLGVPTELGTAE